jgi:alpha-D-xyloside xylohydrolase
VLAVLALACSVGSAAESRFEKTGDGVIVTPAQGTAKRVRLQVMSDRIVRVTATPTESLSAPASLMVVATPATAGFTVEGADNTVKLKTPLLQAEVSLVDGMVKFLDLKGQPLLSETPRAAFVPASIDGKRFYRVQQRFNPNTREGFYGLGQHQNAQMNYLGEDVELSQHNMAIAVPFVMSNRGYGVLWDNNSITRFGNPRAYALASKDLSITDGEGKPGFSTTYSIDGQVKLRRTEPDINYHYIKDLAAWPETLLGEKKSNTTGMRTLLPNQTVVWEGKAQTKRSGTHKFRLYASSYFKLFADGKPVLDGWRQNWNAWYHNFELPMTAGKPVALRIEWTPDDGHIALLHNDPLPDADRNSLSLASEVAHAIDYYYIAGANLDEVIAGYRHLTGKAVMLPRWAYGFWQSRQRYNTQAELLDVVKEYRRRKLPLDNIVQDWFYWREDQWGSHEFDPERFPDPKALIDELHALNAHFMISVWPKFYPATENFKELAAKGHLYRRNLEMHTKDWVGAGYESTYYDPYSEEARSIYWRQIDERLNKLGVDAWWLDATEPDIHSNLDIEEIQRRIGPTAKGPAQEYFNSYSLMTTQGVYEGERRSDPDKRAVILTRSGFAGLQRHAASAWSGDVASRWDDLFNQIAAGTNFSMSGIPNWTFDIGGFALEKRFQEPNEKDLDEWRELNLRWFQFGAFVPLFRSHGEAPFREIYNLAPEGSEVYESLADYNRLRYRLLPYVYSLAGATYHRDGTIMRGLVMDFPRDAAAGDVNDQYLFGPSLLINPVYKYQARSRSVYLPSGTRWYDFYSGEAHAGGMKIDAAAPLARMPIFVKAGAILPIGPEVQHTGEHLDAPIKIYVYRGANGRFELYEDDGVSYGYERGAYSRIPMVYDDANGRLTIGVRSGSYAGMQATRTFLIRWITPGEERAADFSAPVDLSVQYSGQALSVAVTP